MTELQVYMEDKRPEDISQEDWDTYCRVLTSQNRNALMVDPKGYRKYLWELKFFGSDLNKVANLHWSRDMTISSIDIAAWKNDFDDRIRVIEFQSADSTLHEQQNKLLDLLSDIAANNNHHNLNIDLEIFTVKSNSPKFTENTIEDKITGEKYLIGFEKLKKWGSFDYQLTPEDFLDKQHNLF